MENRQWLRAGGTSEMQFSPRATSKGRAWNGFECAIYDTSGGLIENPVAKSYNVSMHIGAPLVATCRCDGSINNRLQIPGDIDIVPFGCAAAWEDDGPSTVLSMHLAPVLVRSVAESMRLNPDRVRIEPQLQVKDPLLQHLGWTVKAELEAADPCGPLYAESLGTALAVHLLRRYALTLEPPINRGLPKRQLNRILEFIQEHLNASLSLTELSGVLGISASHLKTQFKQSMGLPVHQYIIRRRVDFAVELLSGGKRPLSDVAFQAGFADQSHMARCMRRVIGITPSGITSHFGGR